MPNLWFELMDTCLSCHENGPTPEDHKHFGQAFPEAISWISVLGWSATPEGFIYKVSLQSPCQQSILGLVPGHFTHLAPHLSIQALHLSIFYHRTVAATVAGVPVPRQIQSRAGPLRGSRENRAGRRLRFRRFHRFHRIGEADESKKKV